MWNGIHSVNLNYDEATGHIPRVRSGLQFSCLGRRPNATAAGFVYNACYSIGSPRGAVA
jgi:hypothetical protein